MRRVIKFLKTLVFVTIVVSVATSGQAEEKKGFWRGVWEKATSRSIPGKTAIAPTPLIDGRGIDGTVKTEPGNGEVLEQPRPFAAGKELAPAEEQIDEEIEKPQLAAVSEALKLGENAAGKDYETYEYNEEDAEVDEEADAEVDAEADAEDPQSEGNKKTDDAAGTKAKYSKQEMVDIIKRRLKVFPEILNAIPGLMAEEAPDGEKEYFYRPADQEIGSPKNLIDVKEDVLRGIFASVNRQAALLNTERIMKQLQQQESLRRVMEQERQQTILMQNLQREQAARQQVIQEQNRASR